MKRIAFIALLFANSAAPAPAAAPVYDLIIRGGTVFDGSGRPGVTTDVGIADGRIVTVGDLARATAKVERDAKGLYVTPGFVSVHDHSDPTLYGRPESLISQGVTTAITNPDGLGPLDIVAQLSVPGGLGLNYGAYIGFNSVWREVMGLTDHRATLEDTARMQGLVLTALKAGAFGLSAGLDYKPGFWAHTDEVVAVAKVASPWRTNFPNHERVFPGNGNSSVAGMTETIEIGRQAGVMPVITHMKLQGPDRGKAAQSFALFAQAARTGTWVGVDAYPYTFGATQLEQLLVPNWAQIGGMEPMLARFKDPALRPRIIAETNSAINDRWGGPATVYLPLPKKELTAYMAEMGGVSGGEAVVRLLEQGQRNVILRFGTEADQHAIIANPLTAVSCDCGATASSVGHPRQWGSYPRFLGRYVRNDHVVGWAEAVRKMTALPATMVGLAERGYLLPGMIADVTIFDPATVVDRATLAQPTLPSVGIRAVIVNGQLAMEDGRLTDARAGVRLVRSKHEPSRPMNFDVERELTINGAVAGAVVTAKLRQGAGMARPTGTLQMTNLPGGRSFTLVPSIVQATRGWASVTGIGHWKDGLEQAITVEVEEADPLSKNRPSLTVLAGGRVLVDGHPEPGSLAVKLQRHRDRRAGELTPGAARATD